MIWLRAIKVVLASLLLAFGLYGAFVTWQMHPAVGQKVEEAMPSSGFRPGGYSMDGRFGTRCVVCFVPFARLIAFPERYHRREIATYGFLKEFYGTQALFPTEESAKTGGPYENIAVNAKISEELRPKLKAGVWVFARGKFDATFDGQQEGLGLLLDATVSDENVEIGPRLSDPAPIIKLMTVKPVRAEVPQFEIESDSNSER
jgi:hypothetical protein